MVKVLIVDDEPKAITLLSSYLSYFSNFQLVASFRNGLKALEYLNAHAVDVVFLDINMPHLNGLSLSKMVGPNTAIVFTTAYGEHAVESYSLNALDYLLKPISLERFSNTIGKINSKFHHGTLLEKDPSTKEMFVKSGLEIHKILLDNLHYLQKDGNYMYYWTSEKKIMARETVAEALQQLPNDFIRIQKSYIINFRKIETIGTDYVIVLKTKIPIGSQFKPLLSAKLRATGEDTISG